MLERCWRFRDGSGDRVSLNRLTTTKGEVEAMRFRTLFLSSAFVAATALLTAPAIIAGVPLTCMTEDGSIQVTFLGYKTSSDPACPSGQCTEETYQFDSLNGVTANVYEIRSERVVKVDAPGGYQIYQPLVKLDPVAGFDKEDASATDVRVNPVPGTTIVKILVDTNNPVVVRTGMFAKINKTLSHCVVAGVFDGGGNTQITQIKTATECTLGGECCVDTVTDENGKTVVTLNTLLSSPTCSATSYPQANLEVTITNTMTGDTHTVDVTNSAGVEFAGKGSDCTWKQYYATTGDWVLVCK